MNKKINNKKVLSSVLAASSVLSSGYLFYLADGLGVNTNVAYAETDSIVRVVLEDLYAKLEKKGIKIDTNNKSKVETLIEYFNSIGLGIDDIIYVDIDDSGTMHIRSITDKTSGETMTKDYLKAVYRKYKSLWKKNSTDSDVINTCISKMNAFLIQDGKINLDNLKSLNELGKHIIVRSDGKYGIDFTGSLSSIDAVEPVKYFIENTCLKDYSIGMLDDKIVLTYTDGTSTTIDGTQKLLKAIAGLRDKMAKAIEEASKTPDSTPVDPNPTPEDPTPVDPTPEAPTPVDPTPENPTPENVYSGGGAGSSGWAFPDSSSPGSSSTGGTAQAGTEGQIKNEETSMDVPKDPSKNSTVQGDSELMAEGKYIVANLYEKITANNVSTSRISDVFKGLAKTLIDKLEVLLKVPANSSKSLVIDVTSVYDDVKMNDIILNLDKSYIDKEIYISCVYDDKNIFRLTSDNQWVKYEDEVKEVKGVKMDKTSSFKFTGIARPCVFIVTVKN